MTRSVSVLVLVLAIVGCSTEAGRDARAGWQCRAAS